MVEKWDDEEKELQHKEEYARYVEKAVRMYGDIVREYAKINSIELPSKDDDQYLAEIYSFVNDARFIDYALDNYKIIYNMTMFEINSPIPDEVLSQFADVPIDFDPSKIEEEGDKEEGEKE